MIAMSFVPFVHSTRRTLRYLGVSAAAAMGREG